MIVDKDSDSKQENPLISAPIINGHKISQQEAQNEQNNFTLSTHLMTEFFNKPKPSIGSSLT